MKMNFLKVTIIGFIAALFSANVLAVTLTGQTVSARVIKALSMTNTTQLNFGDFVPSATNPETITISNGTFTPSGGITLLSTVAKTPAQFAVSGEGGYAYTVTIPSSISLTGPSGSTPMTFNSMAIEGGSSRTLSGSAGSVGNDTVLVNGVLNVAADQAPGSYSGTYTITAAY